MTEVVAALIWKKDRFLICQRPAHKARGLLWEFVGGKVEPGESPEDALIRECMEELAVTVRPGNVFMETVHEYPDLTVHLILYHAVIVDGTPQLLEHNDLRWIEISDIDHFDFCPADVEILARLQAVSGKLQTALLKSSDTSYANFLRKLIPTLNPEKILGVRMPALRQLTNKFTRSNDAKVFLSQLPHKFYEEDNIHGLLISSLSDFPETIQALDAFLPHVDNWATCDLIIPRVFRSNQRALLPHIYRWLSTGHTYTVRFAIGMLMHFFLEDLYFNEALEAAVSVSLEDYYVKMMVAWFFATALTKDFQRTFVYLSERKLPVWIHNKTIRKAIESYRISDEQKAVLKLQTIKPEKR